MSAHFGMSQELSNLWDTFDQARARLAEADELDRNKRHYRATYPQYDSMPYVRDVRPALAADMERAAAAYNELKAEENPNNPPFLPAA
jgi:hypothetical protein